MLISADRKVRRYTLSSALVGVLCNSFCDLTRSYEDALSDFELAEKNLRGNVLIDYKQLGLQYKLYSCEVGGLLLALYVAEHAVLRIHMCAF